MSAEPCLSDREVCQQGESMPCKSAVVVAGLLTLVACENPTEPERCAGMVQEGELHVVIGPRPGLFGYGEIVFVGDTLPLSAEVRPAVGASIDFWGSGSCAIDYGDPIPAAIEWSSADASIATVNATGAVAGKREGEVVITARAPAQNISGSRDIYVWVRGSGAP
jgi:Bacterial Ig-like domain (group 2)